MTTSDRNIEEPRPSARDDDAERTEGELAPRPTGSSLPDAELGDNDDEPDAPTPGNVAARLVPDALDLDRPRRETPGCERCATSTTPAPR